MTTLELQILAEEIAASSRVLSEGHERDGRPRPPDPITDPSDPSVPDGIKVYFEGAWCRWADLTLQDRKAYMLGGEYGY